MKTVQVNGTPRILASDVNTVADLLRALELAGKRIAIERNGDIVPRSRYADIRVEEGDRLEIVGAVGGG